MFASLTTEVTIENALGAAEHKKQPRVLTANDEWALVRSCELTVKVLGEIPVAPWRPTSWREEVAAED